MPVGDNDDFLPRDLPEPVKRLLDRPVHYKLDDRGEPVPVHTRREDGSMNVEALIEWGRFMEEIQVRRVLLTEVVAGTFVSTVFLGLDHNFYASGPPILWETMVWTEVAPPPAQQWRNREWWDIERRYSNQSEARDGHAEVVAEVRATLAAEGAAAEDP